MGSALSNGNSQKRAVKVPTSASLVSGGKTSRSDGNNSDAGRGSANGSLTDKVQQRHENGDTQRLRPPRSADGISPGNSSSPSPAATQTLTVANGISVPKVETTMPAASAPPGAAQLPAGYMDPRLAAPQPEVFDEDAHDDGYYTEEERRRRRAQPPPPQVEAPPRPIRWQRGEMLGAGAFGKVFLGLNVDTGELIAIKQVSYAGINKQKVEEHVSALEVEIALLKNLQHDNIVRYVGSEADPEHQEIRIFLEYVPGGSIASLIGKFGHLSESVIRVYTRQLLLGLEYLHSHQIMHRDIKGANILVDNSGTIKLADFGASKKLAEIMTISDGHKSLRGTPYWMAPEVIKQTGHGRQADIWSVGCTVLEMATGKPPWSQFQSQVSALFHIASAKGPPPIPEHLSADAHDFLMLCFRRNPKERPNAARLLAHPFVGNLPGMGPARGPAAPAAYNRPAYGGPLYEESTIVEDEAEEAEAAQQAEAGRYRNGGGGGREETERQGGEILSFLADKVQRDYDSLTDERFRDGYASILRQHAAEREEGPPPRRAPGPPGYGGGPPRGGGGGGLPPLQVRGAPAARGGAGPSGVGRANGAGRSPSGVERGPPPETDWAREERYRQYVAELDEELQRMREARKQAQAQWGGGRPPPTPATPGGDWPPLPRTESGRTEGSGLGSSGRSGRSGGSRAGAPLEDWGRRAGPGPPGREASPTMWAGGQEAWPHAPTRNREADLQIGAGL